MKKRPLQVTIVAWFLMVTGAISLITTTMMMGNTMVQELMAKSPLPRGIQYGMAYTGLLVAVTSGYFMLEGRRWARTVYVTWGAIGFITSLITSPMKWALIPGLVVFAVIVTLLFLPDSNAFFSPKKPATDETRA